MIDTRYYSECIRNLDYRILFLQEKPGRGIYYQVWRENCISEFELVLEQSGKLLKKCLRKWFHTPKAADALAFKDIFRYAAHHSLITLEQAERWLLYRDNRNNPANDTDEGFAENTLPLLPEFLQDAKALQQVIENCNDD